MELRMHSAIAHSIVSVVEFILAIKASWFSKETIKGVLFNPIH